MQYSLHDYAPFDIYTSFILTYLKVKHYSIYKKINSGDISDIEIIEIQKKLNSNQNGDLHKIVDYLFNTSGCAEKTKADIESSFDLDYLEGCVGKNVSEKFLTYHLNLLRNFS